MTTYQAIFDDDEGHCFEKYIFPDMLRALAKFEEMKRGECNCRLAVMTDGVFEVLEI